jgi:hypothetical protein
MPSEKTVAHPHHHGDLYRMKAIRLTSRKPKTSTVPIILSASINSSIIRHLLKAPSNEQG